MRIKRKATDSGIAKVHSWLLANCAEQMASGETRIHLSEGQARQMASRCSVALQSLVGQGILMHKSHMEAGHIVGDGYTVNLEAFKDVAISNGQRTVG